jgi:hypothetical protein
VDRWNSGSSLVGRSQLRGSRSVALLDRDTIESIIKSIRKRQFTVLEFGDALKRRNPVVWQRLASRFGEFGEKRRYTVSTYLSNRLEEYSRLRGGLLDKHPRYREDRERGYRRPTELEKKRFGSPWIAVYRRRQ